MIKKKKKVMQQDESGTLLCETAAVLPPLTPTSVKVLCTSYGSATLEENRAQYLVIM